MGTDDERNLGEQIRRVEEQLNGIADALDEVKRTLDRLNVTVRGDSQYGSKGLGPRVTELESRVSRIEMLLNRAIWIATGAGLAGAGVAEIIKAVIGGGG